MTETPGTHEHDDDTTDAPNPESGVGVGAGEPSTFEPEEDPGSVDPGA
ncbi:hypothetical protein [Cellulomonas carbonis]|nr:hypothetical protein [Cellulomonas carbonis]GGB93929.1 hypothetical protein GCM10010972_03260 [Cellulomonas carbonis]